MREVDGGELQGHQVHVGHSGALIQGPVAHAEDVGEGIIHDRLSSGHGGHGSPAGVVHHVASKARELS